MSAPKILCDTKGMSNERWLECRMHGPNGDIPYTVGGSDVAAIFGLSPWITPKELWYVKKGKMNPAAKFNVSQLEMGHLLEPIAAHFYAKKSGNLVFDDTNMYQHADHKYALADFDRRYIRNSDGEPGILECKSTSFRKYDDWQDGAYPVYYELQLRYYMAVADVNHGAFAAIWGNNPENDFAMPELERDKAKEDMIFDKLDRWIWSLEHDVEPTMEDIAPDLALSSLAKIYGASKAGLPTVEFSTKYEGPLRRILQLQSAIGDHNEEIKKLEKEMQAHSVRIAELMGVHEHGVLETTTDKILIDFVTKKSKRPDSTALKKNYPTIYDEVLKTSESRKIKVSVQAK